MARYRGKKQYFHFASGWNTEAAPTTFPENTAYDLDNVIIDVDGSIRRRPGIDYETSWSRYGADFSLIDMQTYGIGFFEWRNVSGSGSINMSVTQCGLNLYFHIINGDATTATLTGSLDFSSFATDVANAKISRIQVADGLGYLFVCGRYIEPFYVTYTGTSFTATEISIKIRDFDGAPDTTFGVIDRPVTAGDSHIYDLLNAGWPIGRINTFCGNTVMSGTEGAYNVITYTASNSWPSRADIQYLGVTTNGSGDLAFDRNQLIQQTFGNTPAPNGHFITNAFSQDRYVLSGLVGVASTNIPTRPETVAFHNGRVFWAGIFTQGLSGNIYYSQQLTEVDKAGNCYQEQDPTAETFNDLLDTDGGLLPIPGAGQIVKIMEGGDGIVVFASNGVWQISGSQGKFSATDFAVTKITDVGCCNGQSVINADNVILYWSDAGIIALQRDQITAQLNDSNLTKNTIQTGYLLLGGINRRFASGAFIAEEKKAVWFYSTDSASDGINDRYKYNGVLVLDTQLGAFYKYSISDTAQTAPYMCGIIRTTPFSSGEVAESVTVGGVDVTVSAVTVTVSSTSYTGVDITAWKILTAVDSATTGGAFNFTMSEFTSRSWHDWFKEDAVGINYTSYLETGYEVFGDVTLDKIPTYVFTYFSPESKSVKAGGYYELPALVSYSAGYRVTQSVKEVLINGVADMRTTQTIKEVLVEA